MKLPKKLSRFLSSDPDYAPFGWALLRGLTPARAALVATICALQVLQADGALLVAEGRPSPGAAALVLLADLWELVLFVSPALLLAAIADNLSANASTAVRAASLALAIVLGAAVFAWLEFDPDPDDLANFGALRLLATDFATVFSWGGLLMGALYFLERERRIGAATLQASLDRIEADGQLAEAQLQMLQAQIEPHFLFNSLATVQSLYQQDAVRGRQLIRDLSEYLRGALPQMREAASTLRKEFTLCQAYLRVLQVRMGDRLKVEIELPPALEHMSVPPMMLPTLIENAIKHGIAPLPRGGTMRIEARRVAGSLQVSVSDNGAGFRHTSGSGIGLANTRARLASLYGREGGLSVAANSDAGVTATLRFPLQDSTVGRPV